MTTSPFTSSNYRCFPRTMMKKSGWRSPETETRSAIESPAPLQGGPCTPCSIPECSSLFVRRRGRILQPFQLLLDLRKVGIELQRALIRGNGLVAFVIFLIRVSE